MAVFTSVLKDVLDLYPNIGLDTYPIFDEAYRPALNQKIIDHFWNREIGQETESLFIHQLRVRMNNIMPLMNQHYEASRIKFDPLKTIDMKNVGQSDSTATNEAVTSNTSAATSKTESASDARSRAVNSDHPQELLSDTGDYASSSGDTIGNSAATGTTDNTGTDTGTNTGTNKQTAKTEGGVSGFQGNAAAVIFQLRATFVNVDMMIINELEDLFMLLWSNGDDYTTGPSRYGYGNFNGYGYGYNGFPY